MSRAPLRVPQALVAALLLAGLAGCSSFSIRDMLSGEEDKLPGEREAILLETDPLVVDPQAAQVPPLPAARANADWSQPGGTATNAPGHLSLSPSPKRAWSTRVAL